MFTYFKHSANRWVILQTVDPSTNTPAQSGRLKMFRTLVPLIDPKGATVPAGSTLLALPSTIVELIDAKQVSHVEPRVWSRALPTVAATLA